MSRKLYRITTTINHPDNMAGFYKDDKDVYDFFKRNIGDEENIMRIAGMSLLPEGTEWPVNPNGEKMVLILNIPTNFLNDKLAYNYPKDKMISVFTTYNLEDYFLDSIVYHGSSEQLTNIKNGFTKVFYYDEARMNFSLVKRLKATDYLNFTHEYVSWLKKILDEGVDKKIFDSEIF